MKYLISFLILIFMGCGGGSSSSNQKDYSEETIKLPEISDPDYYKQWYLSKNDSFYYINNINNYASINSGNYFYTYRGKGIKIAIIDNGLDVNHRDLKGAIIKTYNTTGGTDVSHNLGEKHGTAVTGIIAARANNLDIFGVASSSSIIFFKDSNASDSEVINFFNKAEEFGADIISCSWGTYDVSDAVKETIQNLARNGRGGRGTLIVFASGNDNKDMGNDESSIPEVISVGASNSSNTRASYSNYGINLDILAPGGNIDFFKETGILSLYPNSNYKFTQYVQGTSFSTPLVSGILAMILEANPLLTRIQVEEILKNTSDKIGNVKYDLNGHNIYYGYGKINVQKAINEAKRK